MRFLHLIFVLTFSILSFSQTLQNRVLVIKNTNSAVSVAIANDYMLRRNVTKVLNVSCQDSNISANSEYMSYADFNSQIGNPLIAYLNLHPEIDFIVFTKGIPIHFYDFPNQPYGGVCSVDSYVSSFGYSNSLTSSLINISDPNYNFGSAIYIGKAYINKFYESTVPFSHTAFGGYLVTRLDGYTQADAIALTTRSLQAEANIGIPNTGKILLDADPNYGFPSSPVQPFTLLPSGYSPGQTLSITSESPFGEFNVDMQVANVDLVSRNILVENNTNSTFVGNRTGLNGYYSWGSNDSNYVAANYNSLQFAPGAIAETCVSTGARTFLPTTGGQSLIANLITQGVTGVKGYTDEPLLQAIASPSIMFNRYTKGWTLAESFYAASRLVGWMDIVIGDPICRAYANPLSVKKYNSDSYVSIYPNPSTNFIQINVTSKLQFSDVLGKTVLEIANYQKNTPLDISKLEKGIYFINLKSESNQTIKFLKN
jgi:uncharacterized protein (TIGR03790 family)